MPFFRINDALHYFAHVPKCAGASVEAYLLQRFGPIAFANSRYFKPPPEHRWTKSSPQHVDLEALKLLIPSEWIASSFSVVRHPVSRLRSAFDYQLLGEATVPDGTDINAWFLDWVATREHEPYRYDNHPRPASELVPQDASVFRMEDGLQPIVEYLDNLSGTICGPRKIPHENKSRGGADYERTQAPLTPDVLNTISKVYAEDFRRFGYKCEDVRKSQPKIRPLPKQKRSLLHRLLSKS
jgi:hypothetical protein